MRNKKVVLLGVLAMLPLAACGGGGGNGSSSTGVVSASSVSPSSETSTSSEPVPVTPANGVFTYAAASYSEKAKIVGQLEGFGMDKFLTGIPMYDNGSNVLYSDRIEGMLDTYIPNYGFGVGRASITKAMDAEPTEAYKYYLHSFQTSDPASYNAWASTGSVEIDMMDMYTLGYYGTRPNAAGTNYEWYNSLATAKPIALNRDPDTKMATKWEVPLRFNEDGLVYNTLSTKATLAAFKGVKIQLEDYLTPFKNCLNLGWARSTDLASSASGFAGVQAYSDALSAGKTADWSNVGIQIADDKKGLTFTFNTPKTDFYAMYDLASGMYSPVPQAFMDALIALKTSSQDAKVMYGIFNDTGTGASGLTAVDSVLSTGVYVPEEIKSGQYLTFKKNDTCIEAADYHILGEKDWIWTGAATDATYAYNQYKTNANIDSVRVPTAKIKEEQSNPQRRVTKGDTVWKLNVNSCTQEQWNGFFGDSGTISQQGNDAYKCKPIMSNCSYVVICF